MIQPSSRPAVQPRRGVRRSRLAVASCTVALALAGCGAKANHPNAGHGQVGPAKAINLAAAQRINSVTATISIRSGGLANPVTATMTAQFKPTTFIHMTLKGIAAGSSAANIEEILTSNALYLKSSALSKLDKKPWLKVSLAQLSSKAGVNFGTLLQNLENSNPENQLKLFAISKNVHVVGSQTINGVATTEYAGTYLPAAAVGKLPAGLRKLLGPALRLLGSTPVAFHVWLDAQHLARKAIVDETISGQSLVTTYTITSINQPVTVALPPPSQVAPLP